LKESDFKELVESFWGNYVSYEDLPAAQHLIQKMRGLKLEVVKWQNEKKENLKKELTEVEKTI